MAISIIQQPNFIIQPASTPTVFTVTCDTVVLNEQNVKFLCEVYVGKKYIPMNTNFPVATLKASPNAAGSGIFDVSPVIEAYVDVMQEGRFGVTTNNPNQYSTFKQTAYSPTTPHSIHQIDRFCTTATNLTWYQLRFRIEYLNTSTGRVELDDTHDQSTFIKMAFNGVLTHTNPITVDSFNRYYYDMQDINYTDGSGDYLIRGASGSALGGKFITNMPTKQQMGENDYGTIAFFNCINSGKVQTMPGTPKNNIPNIILEFYNSAGAIVQTNNYDNVPVNGGKGGTTTDLDTSCYWIYFGHGLANMKGRNQTWPSTAVGYKVFVGTETSANAVSRVYDFEIIYDDCRGYEPVRLCWQNRLGAWDYYTFNKKSKKTVKSKRKNYQQLSGTWNEKFWRPKDYLGGMKVFNNQAKETLQLNTDWVSEEIAAWFEELFTSSQVYIVNKFDSNNPPFNFGSNDVHYIHKYIEPVIISSSTYTKKTIANDKQIQYNIKIDKSKPLNVQRA